MLFRRLPAALLLIGCWQFAVGAENAPDETAAQASVTPQESGWESYIEQGQRGFSAEIVETGRWLDGLFGSGVLERDPEGSVLRLGLSSELKRGGLNWSPEIELQLELPRTQERFNFYLQNTVDDAFTEDDENRPVGVASAVDPGRTEERSDDFIAGFGYVEEVAEYVNFRADAGVIAQWPPNPFARMRVRRSYFLGDWQLRLGETVFWSKDRDRGAGTEIVWQHPMTDRYFFRSDTGATYLQRQDEVFYSHEFLITNRLGPREALLYRWAFYSQSSKGTPFTRVVYELRWRRPIYKDWVLMELRPGFDFPQEENFEMQSRVFLTIEALFGDREEYEY